ncbi:hypothetical protein V502_10078, partial [Pseudogymnoascus sp. VKM F-4520 (FW-2644)]
MAGTRPPASVRAEDVQRTHLLRLSAPTRNNIDNASTLQGSKQWVSAGGVTAALLTAPLDVLRTRLQSEFYRRPTPSTVYFSTPGVPAPRTISPARHIRETLQLLGSIHRTEGPRALFRGLGPLVACLGPSSALKFWTYRGVKRSLEG